MPRKAREVVGRPMVPEVIDQKKQIELTGVSESNRATQMHPCAFDGWRGFHDAVDRSNRHQRLQFLAVSLW